MSDALPFAEFVCWPHAGLAPAFGLDGDGQESADA
jgi:hypothetical protein